MKNWLEDNWGWVVTYSILFPVIGLILWVSTYYGRLTYHNERLCNSVGGTWIMVSASYTCARVTPIPLPRPKTPFQ